MTPTFDGKHYIVLIHPKQRDHWLRMVVREKYYWDRHVARFNRRYPDHPLGAHESLALQREIDSIRSVCA